MIEQQQARQFERGERVSWPPRGEGRVVAASGDVVYVIAADGSEWTLDPAVLELIEEPL